jgi:ankyrin repeat protein
LNKPNADLQSPLHYAVKIGKDDIAKLLVESGADINQYDKNGHCPLDEAVKKGSTMITNLLIAYGAMTRETEPAIGKKTTPTKPSTSASQNGKSSNRVSLS